MGEQHHPGEYIVQLVVMSQEQSVEPVSSEEAGMQEEGAVNLLRGGASQREI